MFNLNDYDMEILRKFCEEKLGFDINKEIISDKFHWIHKYRLFEISLGLPHPTNPNRLTMIIGYETDQNKSDNMWIDGYFMSDDFDIKRFYSELVNHSSNEYMSGEELIDNLITALYMACRFNKGGKRYG